MLFCCQHLTLNKVAIWYLIFTKADGLLYVRDHFKLLKLLFLFLSLTLADSLLDKSDFMSQQIDPGRYPRTFQPIIDLSRRDLFFFVILSLTSWAPPRESYVRGDGAVLGASQRYLLAGGFEPATLCIQVSSLKPPATDAGWHGRRPLGFAFLLGIKPKDSSLVAFGLKWEKDRDINNKVIYVSEDSQVIYVLLTNCYYFMGI